METSEYKVVSAGNVSPIYPVHPGEILGEELAARGISGREFAQKAGLQTSHLSAIIHGTRSITQAVADKLAKALEGISADFWLRMQKNYNTEKKRRERGTSRFVSGYHPIERPILAGALAEPGPFYGAYYEVKLRVPIADKELLENLAARMDWDVQA